MAIVRASNIQSTSIFNAIDMIDTDHSDNRNEVASSILTIIDSNPNSVNFVNSTLKTPIDIAITKGLDNIADIIAKSSKFILLPENFITLAGQHDMVSSKFNDILRSLLSADFSSSKNYSDALSAVLSSALIKKNLRAVKKVLNSGHPVNTGYIHNGDDLINLASKHMPDALTALSKAGFDINKQDKIVKSTNLGQAIMHKVASGTLKVEVLNVLFKCKANPLLKAFYPRYRTFLTPYQVAILHHNETLASEISHYIQDNNHVVNAKTYTEYFADQLEHLKYIPYNIKPVKAHETSPDNESVMSSSAIHTHLKIVNSSTINSHDKVKARLSELLKDYLPIIHQYSSEVKKILPHLTIHSDIYEREFIEDCMYHVCFETSKISRGVKDKLFESFREIFKIAHMPSGLLATGSNLNKSEISNLTLKIIVDFKLPPEQSISSLKHTGSPLHHSSSRNKTNDDVNSTHSLPFNAKNN